MYWWMLRALVLALLAALVGCGSSSNTPTTGSARFVVSWPAGVAHSRVAMVEARSLKVEMLSGSVTQAVAYLDRNDGESAGTLTIPKLRMNSYAYLATLYDGPAGTGAILAQGRGTVTVSSKIIPQYLTTAVSPGAQLRLQPDAPILYTNRTLQFTAQANNTDNALILLPPGSLAWSSSAPAVATIDAVTGLARGIQPGQTTVTVSDGGTLTAQTTVTVRYPPPTVDLRADDTDVEPGDAVVLSWSSTNADEVDSSVNFNTTVLNGTLTVYPIETTTYKITVRGPGGTDSDSVTVTVSYPEPTVSLQASRTAIVEGERVTLTWSSDYATSVVRAVNFNTTAVNGSTTVMPTETTTYSLTVRGPGGEKTSSVTVTVVDDGVYTQVK